MPANSTTSTAATVRVSVQIRRSYRRAPVLNIGSTDTDRQKLGASATQRGEPGKGDKQRSKAKRQTRRERGEDRYAKDGLADDGDCYGDDVSVS